MLSKNWRRLDVENHAEEIIAICRHWQQDDLSGDALATLKKIAEYDELVLACSGGRPPSFAGKFDG